MRFKGEYHFLSNFYLADFTYKGVDFTSSEQAYMHSKAESDFDRMLILSNSNPMHSKSISYGFKIDVKAWNKRRLQVMGEVLRAKFSIDWFKDKLIATGDTELIEGTTGWHDNFWGKCDCKKCEKKEKYNHLGLVLMEIRAEFALNSS